MKFNNVDILIQYKIILYDKMIKSALDHNPVFLIKSKL